MGHYSNECPTGKPERLAAIEEIKEQSSSAQDEPRHEVENENEQPQQMAAMRIEEEVEHHESGVCGSQYSSQGEEHVLEEYELYSDDDEYEPQETMARIGSMIVKEHTMANKLDVVAIRSIGEVKTPKS